MVLFKYILFTLNTLIHICYNKLFRYDDDNENLLQMNILLICKYFKYYCK